jgi:NAD(P)-dependent dehydrogenase (short-subunit alcohol dehydrogenase family)
MQSKMTVETFGQLDILVNNAGTAIPKSFDETTLKCLPRSYPGRWENGALPSIMSKVLRWQRHYPLFFRNVFLLYSEKMDNPFILKGFASENG